VDWVVDALVVESWAAFRTGSASPRRAMDAGAAGDPKTVVPPRVVPPQAQRVAKSVCKRRMC
jgi:hypothetical protein